MCIYISQPGALLDRSLARALAQPARTTYTSPVRTASPTAAAAATTGAFVAAKSRARTRSPLRARMPRHIRPARLAAGAVEKAP